MLQFERRWAQLILASFAPEGGPGLAPLPGEVDYVATFESMQLRARPLARVGLRAALWLVALAPLWLLGRFGTCARLSLAERQALLVRLAEHRAHPVREATFMLKLAACLALFASDDLRARSGYDGRVRHEAPLSIGRGPR
jgi:hypothetical protein